MVRKKRLSQNIERQKICFSLSLWLKEKLLGKIKENIAGRLEDNLLIRCELYLGNLVFSLALIGRLVTIN